MPRLPQANNQRNSPIKKPAKTGGVTIPKLFTKELKSEEIYANHVYVLGYDLLKLHEKTLNVLIKNDILTEYVINDYFFCSLTIA